jgi:thiamine biosynthesis lipoprotein
MRRVNGLGPAALTFHALGTTATVVTTDPEVLDEAHFRVARELSAFDAACSRFRTDSELSHVNESAGRSVAIGPLLCEALEAALAAAATTDGAVDPTVGASLVAIGYRHDFWSSPPSPAAGSCTRPAGGWRAVELDASAGRVRVPVGVRLDVGATAKALASDRAASSAALLGCGVLVSLGGDISVAGAPPADGWTVRVTDDHRASTTAPGQTVAISEGGLATSSTVVRAWTRDGVEMHHIVRPETGAPADPVWRTVSVAGSTCLEANVASTASIVLGEPALRWLAERALPARLVRRDGEVITVAGWPDPVPETAGT